ncbi:MAG: hypothetical protein ACE5H2_08630 [Terriglobia bacterium]
MDFILVWTSSPRALRILAAASALTHAAGVRPGRRRKSIPPLGKFIYQIPLAPVFARARAHG